MPELKAIDFFCGAGGMSFGLQTAGIKVLAGIDNDELCQSTYKYNLPTSDFINFDIRKLTVKYLVENLKLQRNDPNLILVGCSPCQYWSKIRTDKTKSKQTANLLENFQRFIRVLRPGFVVIENVPGLHNKKNETTLSNFHLFLKKQGYFFDDGVVNASHYGVPQNRMRYLLIASKEIKNIKLPPPDTNGRLTVSDFLGINNGFANVTAGHRDSTKFQHTSASLSSENLQRIKLTPKSGGDRSSWKDIEHLQINAYKNKDNIFRDVYGRMFWDRPAPTITTRFTSFSNGRFGHPEEDRAISIREGATLQTFPKDFYFCGSNMAHLAQQIGNAVPPELARRIGIHLTNLHAISSPCSSKRSVKSLQT